VRYTRVMLTPTLTAVFVALLLIGEVRDLAWLRIATKVPASLGFIVYGWQRGALDGHPDGLALFVALWLCAFGDWFLLSREKKPFLAGIASFLLGHVGYLVVFFLLGVDTGAALAAALVLGGLAVGVWRWVGPHAGALKPAVAAYIGVISLMVAASFGSVALEASPRRMTLVAGAVLFFLSDLCVARDRFVAPGPQNRMVGLPLYYAGQLLFAAAAS
jgi:uncharacterized membrane protein YhhN